MGGGRDVILWAPDGQLTGSCLKRRIKQSYGGHLT